MTPVVERPLLCACHIWTSDLAASAAVASPRVPFCDCFTGWGALSPDQRGANVPAPWSSLFPSGQV